VTQLSEGFDFTRNGVDPSQWPKLSCSQANQLALEVSDLRLDAEKKILFQGKGEIESLGDICFLTGNSSATERLRILANGNVGIGTTSPATKLEVYGGRLTVSASDANKAGVIELSNGSKTNYVFTDGSTGDLFLRTDSPNHNLILQAGGSQGNVGIGTTTPTHKFHVLAADAVGLLESTGSQAYLRLSTREGLDNRVEITNRPGGRLSLWTAGAGDVFNITRVGNVGIGTTSPAARLEISDSFRGSLKLLATSGLGHDFGYDGGGDSLFWFTHYGAESGETKFRWDNGTSARDLLVIKNVGNVGIGTTAPAYKLDVAGAAHASSFPTSSDVRLKKDVTQLTNVLEKLEKIRGVAFEWNGLYESLGRSTGHKEIGAVFPELVTTWGDEGYKAVDYGRLTGVLIEAAKELKAENEALKQRIEVLERAIEKR
jgi:hypothetical protein